MTIRLVDWLDNTRDIANFMVHCLPEDMEETVLPLVVVGHSFGGCTS